MFKYFMSLLIWYQGLFVLPIAKKQCYNFLWFWEDGRIGCLCDNLQHTYQGTTTCNTTNSKNNLKTGREEKF